MRMKTFKVEVQIFDDTDSKAIENILEYAFDEAGIDGVCYVEEVEEKKASVDETLIDAESRAFGAAASDKEQEVVLA